MKSVLAMLLVATACVVGSTPGFARGGGHGGFGGFGHMGGVRNPTTLLGSPAPTRLLSKTGFRARSRPLRRRRPSMGRPGAARTAA
jgi:hypothetical protein